MSFDLKTPFPIWAYLVVFVLVCSSSLLAQSPFQKTYGSINGNEANAVITTSAGGYGIAGWYDVEGLFTAEFYLIITNSVGDTLWTRTYGEKSDTTGNFINGSGNEGYNLLQTADNGFLFVGERHQFAGGQSDAYAVRVDSLGELLWAKTYGGSDNDYALAAEQTADGGFVFGGFTESYGAGIRDMYLFKTDHMGEILWTRTYGGGSIDAAFDMQQTSDGGFILAGYTFSFSGSSDIYVIRTDSEGAVLWQKTYGGELNDIGNAIIQTQDDGFIICGETESFDVGNVDVYLLKINGDGDVDWAKTYGGSDFESGKSIVESTEGGYMVAGYTRSFGSGGEDFYLIKTDESGDLVWANTYGGAQDDAARSIKQTTDQGYIVAGYTKSFGIGFSDIYLIKTNSLGDSGCNQDDTNTEVTDVVTTVNTVNSIVQDGGGTLEPNTRVGYTNTGLSNPCDIIDNTKEIAHEPRFRLFPNPTRQYLTLEPIGSDGYATKQIFIYDILGQELLSDSKNDNNRIDISSLPNGVFTLRLLADGQSFSFVFVKG